MRLSKDKEKVLEKLCRLFKGENIDWALTGSVSFVLQGVELTTDDIDIQTDRTVLSS